MHRLSLFVLWIGITIVMSIIVLIAVDAFAAPRTIGPLHPQPTVRHAPIQTPTPQPLPPPTAPPPWSSSGGSHPCPPGTTQIGPHCVYCLACRPPLTP